MKSEKFDASQFDPKGILCLRQFNVRLKTYSVW